MTDAVVVDARAMRCPWPVLRLSRAMRGTAKVHILADDPQAEREFNALAREQGWDISAHDGGWLVQRP